MLYKVWNLYLLQIYKGYIFFSVFTKKYFYAFGYFCINVSSLSKENYVLACSTKTEQKETCRMTNPGVHYTWQCI